MSLRERLTKPLVLGPAGLQHTHTVIFLHLFEPDVDDETLRTKVLAAKQTKDHRTLEEQFPTVRWVFPHPKNGSVLHWSKLSTREKHGLNLTMPGVPYVTQIILQEAQRTGGLDRIVLGGQGKTAEAAHDAMSSFPQRPASTTASEQSEDMTAAHLQKHFHPNWTKVTQLRMAGFVGMHVPMTGPQVRVTRDVRDYGIQAKLTGPPSINNAIVKNTPHRFMHGGYKTQTTTWDGHRIDDFAAFLEDIGVVRIKINTEGETSNETLIPIQRSVPVKRNDTKDELSERQKYALEIMKQKGEDEKRKEIILRRIEADRVERKIRKARESEARFYRDQARRGQSSQAKIEVEERSSDHPVAQEADAPALKVGVRMDR